MIPFYGKTREETIAWLMARYKVTEEQVARRKLFLEELKVLCQKHNVSICHEDRFGAFELGDFDWDNFHWLQAAHGGIYE